ncbi:RNA-guided endonuclease InsQ/TnpB family protein [Embleya hyalina]|uniref:Transposase n=1 Tax=Embleya hyalina TaxID=516124 RepID=A0A401YQS5_9ACTN|nr:RNA-guided endonuclease TnpB family protein [Embleya hyalina]GCD96943.1 transposase [Embleya hyalina]
MRERVVRAFRFALDPTPTQLRAFQRHAGAARWAFNWAHGLKLAAQETRRAEIAELVAAGHTRASAARAATTRVPTKAQLQKQLNALKGDSRVHLPPPDAPGPHRPCPWWHEVSTYAFQSAFDDCDIAWLNRAKSLSGERAGRVVGPPRFKKKGRARDAFRLYGKSLRPEGYRRVLLPKIGSVRLHESTKRLSRLIDRGHAVLKCVTVSRAGNRWYASILAEVEQEIPARPTRRQRAAGTVGVDLGVRALATLSRPLEPDRPDSDRIPHPRLLERNLDRLAKAQRRYARTRAGSNRRSRAARRVGALHARIAEQRSTHHHRITKRLTTTFAVVGIENLDLVALTAATAGVADIGSGVRARFNRLLHDAALGEFRRQLLYKARWYGCTPVVVDRGTPTNRVCSSCGWENPPLRPGADLFTCHACDLRIGRAVNSARNIHRIARHTHHVAPDGGETSNARGGGASEGIRVRDTPATKREGPNGSPRRGNPPAIHGTDVGAAYVLREDRRIR